MSTRTPEERYIHNLWTELQTIWADAAARLEQAAKKRLLRHSLKAKSRNFAAGDIVLLSRPFKKKGLTHKLGARHRGPYRIMEILNEQDARICGDDESQQFTVHINHLVPIIDRPTYLRQDGQEGLKLDTAQHLPTREEDESTSSQEARPVVVHRGRTGRANDVEWEVEAVKDMEMRPEGRFYLVTWKGTDSEGQKFPDTWCREESLDCPNLVMNYLLEHAPDNGVQWAAGEAGAHKGTSSINATLPDSEASSGKANQVDADSTGYPVSPTKKLSATVSLPTPPREDQSRNSKTSKRQSRQAQQRLNVVLTAMTFACRFYCARQDINWALMGQEEAAMYRFLLTSKLLLEDTKPSFLEDLYVSRMRLTALVRLPSKPILRVIAPEALHELPSAPVNQTQWADFSFPDSLAKYTALSGLKFKSPEKASLISKALNRSNLLSLSRKAISKRIVTRPSSEAAPTHSPRASTLKTLAHWRKTSDAIEN